MGRERIVMDRRFYMRGFRRCDGIFQPDWLDVALLEAGRAAMGGDIKHNNGIALRQLVAVRAMEGEEK